MVCSSALADLILLMKLCLESDCLCQPEGFRHSLCCCYAVRKRRIPSFVDSHAALTTSTSIPVPVLPVALMFIMEAFIPWNTSWDGDDGDAAMWGQRPPGQDLRG